MISFNYYRDTVFIINVSQISLLQTRPRPSVTNYSSRNYNNVASCSTSLPLSPTTRFVTGERISSFILHLSGLDNNM